jgi:hypothetical protein
MHIVQDLDGLNIARVMVDLDPAGAAEPTAKLVLTSPSGFGTQGGFFPAESFTLESVGGIAALYALLGDALREIEGEPQGGEVTP